MPYKTWDRELIPSIKEAIAVAIIQKNPYTKTQYVLLNL